MSVDDGYTEFDRREGDMCAKCEHLCKGTYVWISDSEPDDRICDSCMSDMRYDGRMGYSRRGEDDE